MATEVPHRDSIKRDNALRAYKSLMRTILILSRYVDDADMYHPMVAGVIKNCNYQPTLVKI